MINDFTLFPFLSNFHPCQVELDGIVFPSSEHAYVACKTNNREQKLAISLIATPGKVKRIGRKLTVRPDWEEVKVSEMERVVRSKFEQNLCLMAQLLSTSPHELVEGNSWGDTFWGQCDGIGSNHLGLILMKIRDE